MSDGRLELKWATENLNAPKGLFCDGDTLWVTDIDEVKSFNSKTGAWISTVKISGSEFLNDITVNKAGDVFVTDSGLNSKGVSSGGKKDAVYKITDGKVSTVKKSKDLKIPNGIYQSGEDFIVTSFADKGIYKLSSSGVISDVTPVAGQIDGIEKVQNEEYLISSWVPSTKEATTKTSGSIRRGKLGGEFKVDIDGINAPADIGFNPKTNEVLIPMFKTDEVRIYPLDKWAQARRECTRACKAAADAAFTKDNKDDMGVWKTCNMDCHQKHQGATLLTLGATVFTMATILF